MEDFYCKNGDCEEIATYGYNPRQNIFCKKDALDDMVLTFQQDQIKELQNYEIKTGRKCYYTECEIRPLFNFENQDNGICCKTHSLYGMIDVVNPKCNFENCKTRACYNLEDETTPIRCAKHKEENMINVVTKMCIICLTTVPSFNYPDKKTPLYCVTCKLENMIDIKSKMCQCGKHRPLFGYPEDDIAEYCSICKEPGMKNIIDKKCDCGLARPSFNYEGLPPRYCVNCKLQNMVNIVSNMCVVCDKIQASFNYEDEEKPTHCGSCKLLNMINIRNKKCLCGKSVPHFNYSTETIAICCAICKKSDMINILEKKCKNNWCSTRANPKYKDYCFRCFIHEFPDQEISRNYKIKERYVTDYIKEIFPKQFVYDKRVTGGCSLRRPDVYMDLLTHVVIIEIDENQHKNKSNKYYNTTCQIARINELFTDFGDRPIVFIYFNPDGYILKNIKYPSSFKYHETLGVPIIRDKEEWDDRLETLKNCIFKHIENIPLDTMFEYLYYDEI
jgi:hypothetical protein